MEPVTEEHVQSRGSSLDQGRKKVEWLSYQPSHLSRNEFLLAESGNDGEWFGVFQIDGLEEKLARCRQSMEEVDLKLRREKLSPEGRKSLERERNLLMTKADNYGCHHIRIASGQLSALINRVLETPPSIHNMPCS
ncbi:hypothetical protein WISP_146758 [Willisornis vidua]|uniref:Coiled-coil domain-containing protein 167 n=1 Tax=Willisornis vidua TaxID=1566151 RepID=A0ABQ9CQD7_9PASS|nr:hypothetical protein WISP_146758 [Willisornis vidua]